jgi:hypothetical protein
MTETFLYTIFPISTRKGWTKMSSKRNVNMHAQTPRTPENMKRILQQADLLDTFNQACNSAGEIGDLVILKASAGIAIASGDPAEAMQEFLEAGKKAGIDPVLLHAMKKTGWILSEDNMQFLSEEELEEWNDAIEEGRKLFGHESTRGR